MKKTQWIELGRTIRKSFVTFLSISIIIALGVSVYLGINYAAQALRDMKNSIFWAQDYRDFEIVSALGMDQENLETLRSMDEIEEVEGNYIVDGVISKDKKNEKVNLAGLMTRLNKAILEEGREPENEKECVVDQALAKSLGVKPGDTLTVRCTAARQALDSGEYKVTGIVSYVDSYKNHRFVFFRKDCFKKEVFEDGYTNLYVKMNTTGKQDLFGNKYTEQSDTVLSLLKKNSDELSTQRYQRIYDKWKAKIDEGKQQLQEAFQKLQEGEQKVRDGETQITQNEEKLAAAQEKIRAGEKELQDGWTKLENGKAQLATAKTKLDAAWKELEDGKAQLESGKNQLESGEEQLKQAKAAYEKSKEDLRAELLNKVENVDFEELPDWAADWLNTSKDAVEDYIRNFDVTEPTDDIIRQFGQEMGLDEEGINLVFSVVQKLDVYSKLKQAEADIAQGQEQLDAGWKEYQEKSALYNEKRSEYDSKYAEYKKGQQTYQNGLKTYQKKSKELEDGKTRLAQGQQQLEDAKGELEKGKEELRQKQQEYDRSAEKLKAQETKLNELQKTPCYILGRDASRSYKASKQQSSKLAGIGFTFALTLMLVAIMVCYASISRMIQEQRQLIGAQKALGFTTGEIMRRYLLYAATSVLLGLVVGISMAYYLIQPICVRAYAVIGRYDANGKSFLLQMTVVVSVCAILVSLVSTWLACHKLLKRPAIELMKEEVPQGAGTFLDRFAWWNKMPLLTKATVNNMVTEKARVFTTLAGVIGCTILLVMGFSLKLSSDKIPDRHYNDLITYDQEVKVSAEKTTEDTEQQIQDVLKKYNVSWIPGINQAWTYMVGDYVDAAALIGSTEDISDYYTLLDRKTGEKLQPVKDGVLICEEMADAYGIGEGDSIQLFDASGKLYELKIRGVYENYIWQNIVISPEYYQEVFGEEMPQTSRFLKLNGAPVKQLKADLREIDSVTGFSRSDVTRSSFKEMSSATNVVLIMMIGMSILMALMILLNLAVMNINQKKRELAVMRVNGFTLRETKRYVGMDTIFITVAGIIFGVAIGTVLTSKVQNTLNTTDMHFLKGIEFEGWGISILLIVVFTVVIRWIANQKIRKLKLTNVNDA